MAAHRFGDLHLPLEIRDGRVSAMEGIRRALGKKIVQILLHNVRGKLKLRRMN
jgi:hypothetical protein